MGRGKEGKKEKGEVSESGRIRRKEIQMVGRRQNKLEMVMLHWF